MHCHRLIAALIVCTAAVGCARHQPARVQAPSAKNGYHSASPSVLSGYIRNVLRASRDNTSEEAFREQLRRQRPEFAAPQKQAEAAPRDLETRRAMAQVYLEEERYGDALGLYQEILSNSPDDVDAEMGLAWIWDELGVYRTAQQHAEIAAALSPSTPETFDLLGRIALHRKDPGAALNAFLASLALSPENPWVLADSGYAHLLRGEWEQAKDCLEHALKIRSSLTEARNHLGIALAQLGDREAALHQFQEVGSPATALNNLGTVYLAQNRLEEARAEFLKALRLQPGYSRAQANLLQVESRMPLPVLYEIQTYKAPDQIAAKPLPKPFEVDFSALLLVIRVPLSDNFRSVPLIPARPVSADIKPIRTVSYSGAQDSHGAWPITAQGYRAEDSSPSGLDYVKAPGNQIRQQRVKSRAADPGPAAAGITGAAGITVAAGPEESRAHEVKPARTAGTVTIRASKPAAPVEVVREGAAASSPKPQQAVSPRFAIQVASVRTEDAAQAEKQRLERASLSAGISRVDLRQLGIWYRVRLPGYSSLRLALDAAKKFLAAGLIADHWVVKEDDM